jgi:hypothetical protein
MGSGLSRVRLRNPLSIVLIAVIGLLAASLLASELYARHRAESEVAAATECVVQDKASVSFGATPLLLQLATGHYRNISIHTAGNRIGNARGMKADVRIDDVRLDGDAGAMGTVGALDAMITWSADGMKQSIQEAIPLLRGLVTGVQTNPDDGTIKLQGNLGSVTSKPQVTDGRVALQVVDVTGLGLLLPSEMVQSALDAFTTHLTENYPLDIHADSVQITGIDEGEIDAELGEGAVEQACLREQHRDVGVTNEVLELRHRRERGERHRNRARHRRAQQCGAQDGAGVRLVFLEFMGGDFQRFAGGRGGAGKIPAGERQARGDVVRLGAEDPPAVPEHMKPG